MTATTRDQLLDTAERLFAERGVDGVSLREITSHAGANVAAVNYHFGSKENLVREVFRRRLEPLSAERLALLESFEKRSRTGRLRIEQILHAFVHPVIQLMTSEPDRGADFVRLMGHVHSSGDLSRLVMGDLQPLVERFFQATRKALPGVEPAEIHWRAHFTIGAMVHIAASARLLPEFTGGLCRVENADEISRRLVAFLAGGFKADPSRLAIGGIADVHRKGSNS